MKIRTIGLALAFSFLGTAACLAADPPMGTWKLNETKSKIIPGTLKNTRVSLPATCCRISRDSPGHGFDEDGGYGQA